MPGEGIVPPQGMNVINEKRTIYGLPMAIGAGGSGTQVKAKTPTSNKQGSGQTVKLISGDYTPATLPPTMPGGFVGNMKTGSGQSVAVIPDAQIPKCQPPSACRVIIVTPTVIKNGGGQQSVKISI